MMFRTVTFFALATSILSVLANPTHLEQRDAAADNIVYVTDANKFWCVHASLFLSHCTHSARSA